MLKNKKLKIVLAALVSTLVGCGSPILRFEAPGYDLNISKAPPSEPDSMDQAIEKLNYFHAKYYEAIRDQQNTVQNTSTGLVWLGAGITALAAGHTHRDAILGTSLIGGTTYAVARTQLDARRVDVWQEGMEALDCAKEATIPLNIGNTRLAQLQSLRNDLVTARVAVKRARDQVQVELNSVAKAPPRQAGAARELIKTADAAILDVDKTLSAADHLQQAARGLELSAAVDRINSKVTRAMNNFQGDISSVKQMLAGIGGFSAVFAPGVDTSFNDVFAAYRTEKSAQDITTQEKRKLGSSEGLEDYKQLDNAVENLRQTMQLLLLAQSQIKSILGDVDTGSVSAALKRCNVTPPPTALTLTPSSLQFAKGGGTRGFSISGGTPPYEVSLLDTPANHSVSTFFSGGFADAAQVNVTDAAPAGDYTVLVKDSSTAKHVQALLVHVQTTEASDGSPKPERAAPNSGSTPANTGTATAWKNLVAALIRPDFSPHVQDITIGVESAQLKDGRLRVVVKCDKPPTSPVPIAKLRELLATADKTSVSQLRQANVLDANFSQIDVAASKSCIKN